MSFNVAFAVNSKNQIEEKHFGGAAKYLIYKKVANKMMLSSEIINSFHSPPVGPYKGSQKRVDSLIENLKKKNVNVLVSAKYCDNINVLNKYFIPVKILQRQPDIVLNRINKNLYWMEEEWKHHSTNFKLFTISSGILKTTIN